MPELPTFADRLKLLRKEKHLTQKDISIRSGIAEPTITKYETGKLNPKFETVQKLANALGVSVSALYGVSDFSEFDNKYHSDYLSVFVKLLELAEKFDPLTYDLLYSFDQLKPEGKRKAIDYVHDLTLIDQYIKPEE